MANLSIVNTAKASQFFKPVAGLLPSGVLTTDAFNAATQTYLNIMTTYWNSSYFNSQGQQWEPVNGSDITQGVINAATPRTLTNGGPYYNHVTEFEFLFTGSYLDIAFIGSAYYDMQVYVEWGNRMYRAETFPLTGTTTGTMYRRMVFGIPFHGRIRVHLGGANFVGVISEQSAIIRSPINRLYAVLDGDEWADGAGIHQSSGVSYLTAGVADFLFELTGIVWARRGQAKTGFFNDSSATVTDDTPDATTNSTRFFSASREGWLTGLGPSGQSDFAGLPLFYLLLGSLNDGGRSGATGSASGPMTLRALTCYQWLRSQDNYMRVVHVSPPPFTGSGGSGTATGPPVANNPNDLNRQEQAIAISYIPKASYVNSFGPSTSPAPWWTGTGSNASPATSQQAQLIGLDGANANYLGYNFYAAKISYALGQMLVNSLRAWRQV